MRKENKKGITLIALVITIIVLLVLAGVSLILVLGDNGVINKAQNATTETRDAEEKEKMEMAVAAARAAGNGTLTTDNLNSELGKFFANGMLGEETEQGWSYFIADKKYNIDKIGRVDKQTSLIPAEYQSVKYIESTGTQYIDTCLLAKDYSDIYCEIKGNYTKIVSNKYIFGAGSTSTSWNLIGILINTKDFGAQKGSSETEVKLCTADLNEHIFKLDLRKCSSIS